MEDPDRPGDHACPHTLVTSIPDGIHKHKHTHNVNRWIEAKWASTTHGWPTRPLWRPLPPHCITCTAKTLRTPQFAPVFAVHKAGCHSQ